MTNMFFFSVSERIALENNSNKGIACLSYLIMNLLQQLYRITSFVIQKHEKATQLKITG